MTHPDQIGNYKITGELARGGQGIVYRAYHATLKTQVALKILLDPDPINNKRFIQEARVLATIKHPHLLEVLDYGSYRANNTEFPYMVMEFIEGTDLNSMLKREGIPELKWIVGVVSTIGEVLNHLHQFGVVHRDLKPANILIEKDTDRPVLIDFGLVKRDPKKLSFKTLDRSRMSQSGEIAGTPAYMSPEQVDSTLHQIGPWTDVYGLGATLYNLLTGELPYKGGAISIYSKLMDYDTPPPDPRSVNPEIPDYLAEAVMASIQKDAALRPQEMRSFIASIQPPAPRIRPRGIRRFSRRGLYPALIGTGFAALVAYFISQGVPRHYAEKLAEQKIVTTNQKAVIQPTPSPVHSATPVPIATYSNIDEAMKLAINKIAEEDYHGALGMSNQMLTDFPNSKRLQAVYGIRADAYYNLALKASHNDQWSEAKEFYLRGQADYNYILSLLPTTKNQAMQKAEQDIHTRLDQIESGLRALPQRNPRKILAISKYRRFN